MIGSQQAQDVINSNDENDVLGRIRIVDSLLRHGWMIELYAHREARPEHVHWPNSRFHSLGIVEIANSYPLHKNLQLSLFPPTDPGFSRFMRVDKTHVDKPDAFKDHAIVTLKTFWRVDDMIRGEEGTEQSQFAKQQFKQVSRKITLLRSQKSEPHRHTPGGQDPSEVHHVRSRRRGLLCLSLSRFAHRPSTGPMPSGSVGLSRRRQPITHVSTRDGGIGHPASRRRPRRRPSPRGSVGS